MLIACPFCRGQMEVADDVQQKGGSFGCPHCQKAITVPPGGRMTGPHQQVKQPSRKISLPKLSLPSLPSLPTGLIMKVLIALLVAGAALAAVVLILRTSCTPSTPKALEAELAPVFKDLHAVERAMRCEELAEQKQSFEAGKPYELEKTDESGEVCREVSKTLPSKRRLRCQKFADRFIGLMEKDTKVDTSSGRDKLVLTCLREFNPAAIDCVLTARNRDAAEVCRDVERPDQGEESASEYGGLTLVSRGECKELETSLPQKVARHGNTLDLQIGLHCDSAGAPTLTPDTPAELTARASIHEALPKVVRAVGENKISPNIGACYFQLKKQVLGDRVARQKLGCQTLSAEIERITPGMVVDLAIFDEILDRYGLASAFDEHTAEDVVGWSTAVENETIPAYVQAFLLAQKEELCGEDKQATMAEQYQAALAAARNCM